MDNKKKRLKMTIITVTAIIFTTIVSTSTLTSYANVLDAEKLTESAYNNDLDYSEESSGHFVDSNIANVEYEDETEIEKEITQEYLEEELDTEEWHSEEEKGTSEDKSESPIEEFEYARDQLEDYINSVYITLLGRQADEVGISSWKEVMTQDGKASDLISGIIKSSEFESMKMTDDEYISVIAAVCLNRELTGEEKKEYIELFENGFSRKKALEIMIQSPEYINLCKELGVVPGMYKSKDLLDSHKMVTDFVNRMYLIALKRQADDTGRRDWVRMLVDNELTAAQVVWGFLDSDEYNLSQPQMSKYVEDLYLLLLDRASDENGLSNWMKVAETGVSRKYIANRFIRSEEFTNLCGKYQIVRGELLMSEARDIHHKVANMVVSHYVNCLNRYPSGEEINYWVEQVIKGYASDLVYGVFLSSEYQSKNKTKDEFVDDLYKSLLLRNPDNGKKDWIDKLNKGKTRNDIIKQFLSTEEFGALCDKYGIEPFEKHRFPRAVEVLDKVGWSLRAAFDWSSGMPYYGHTDDMPSTPDNGMEWFCNYGYDHYKGNCYVMAGTFYQMAIELGYKARQVYGRVPRVDGTYSTHSWVEIIIDGTTYVFDPQFEGKTGRNGYYFTYGRSGTWRYIKDGVMASW